MVNHHIWGSGINTDGASRGNPRPCAYRYSIRNEAGNLLYAESQCFGTINNIVAEAKAILGH